MEKEMGHGDGRWRWSDMEMEMEMEVEWKIWGWGWSHGDGDCRCHIDFGKCTIVGDYALMVIIAIVPRLSVLCLSSSSCL